MANRHVFHGTGVSAGIACGPAVFVAPAAGVDPHEPPCTDPEADGQRVRAAFDDVAASLLARAANAPEASPILEATATLSLIHISEPTRLHKVSRMPSSA